jgi:isoleucyl-tRNA synthetase
VLYAEDANDVALFAAVDLAEIAITSAARVEPGEGPPGAFRLPDVPGVAATFHGAEGRKCARCWMVLPEVGALRAHEDLCRRCSDTVETLDGAAA